MAPARWKGSRAQLPSSTRGRKVEPSPWKSQLISPHHPWKRRNIPFKPSLSPSVSHLCFTSNGPRVQLSPRHRAPAAECKGRGGPRSEVKHKDSLKEERKRALEHKLELQTGGLTAERVRRRWEKSFAAGQCCWRRSTATTPSTATARSRRPLTPHPQGLTSKCPRAHATGHALCRAHTEWGAPSILVRRCPRVQTHTFKTLRKDQDQSKEKTLQGGVRASRNWRELVVVQSRELCFTGFAFSSTTLQPRFNAYQNPAVCILKLIQFAKCPPLNLPNHDDFDPLVTTALRNNYIEKKFQMFSSAALHWDKSRLASSASHPALGRGRCAGSCPRRGGSCGDTPQQQDTHHIMATSRDTVLLGTCDPQLLLTLLSSRDTVLLGTCDPQLLLTLVTSRNTVLLGTCDPQLLLTLVTSRDTVLLGTCDPQLLLTLVTSRAAATCLLVPGAGEGGSGVPVPSHSHF